MSEEQAKSFIDQATQSVQSGQFAQALEFIEKALELAPNDSETYVLQGICLSQTGRTDDATTAFRKAITVSPYNAKAYYNLAVHQYQNGNKVEALAMAEEAAKIDVKHANARALIDTIKSESDPKPAAVASTYNPADPLSAPSGADAPPKIERPTAPTSAPVGGSPQPYAQRPGYQEPRTGITFIQNMGSAWLAIGWVLAAISLAGIAIQLGQMMPMFSVMSSGNSAEIKRVTEDMQAHPNILGQVLGFTAFFGILLWTILDIIDRKGNFLWLIPQVLCTCCGLGWVTLPIYILAGRKS